MHSLYAIKNSETLLTSLLNPGNLAMSIFKLVLYYENNWSPLSSSLTCWIKKTILAPSSSPLPTSNACKVAIVPTTTSFEATAS